MVIVLAGSAFAGYSLFSTPKANPAEETSTPSPPPNPFFNNYHLVEANDIALVWTAPTNNSDCSSGTTPINVNQEFPQSVCMAAATFTTTSDSLNNFSAINEVDKTILAQFPLESGYSKDAISFNAQVATGDFNGDGRSDMVTVGFNTQSNGIVISTGSDTTAAIIQTLSSVNKSKTPHPSIGLCTGDFDGDLKDEIILSWADSQFNVQIIEINDSMQPVKGDAYHSGSYNGADYYPQLSIAAGNFNGDTLMEFVVAHSFNPSGSPQTATLALDLFSINAQQNITHHGQYTNDTLAVGQPVFEDNSIQVAGQLSVESGDITGDNIDDIILAWGTPSGHKISGQNIYSVNSKLAVYTVSDSSNTISKLVEHTSSDQWDYIYESVAVGDFDSDLIDEIVLVNGGFQNSAPQLNMEIYSYSNGSLTQRVQKKTQDFVAATLTNWPAGSFWNLVDVAVNDLNGNTQDEIVLAWRPSDNTCNACFTVGIFTVPPTITSIDDTGVRYSQEQTLGYTAGPSQWIGGHISLALGDFSGNGVWVGPPKTYTINASKQILGIINEPPKHEDWWEDSTGTVTQTLNVNNNTDTYVKYENKQSASTSMGLTLSRDWSSSDGLKGSIGKGKFVKLEGSINKTYGNGFTNKYSAIQSMDFGSDVYAEMDDYIVLLETGYTAWEYPVYTGTSVDSQGHILVVFPNTPINENVITYIQGTQLGSYYKPDHETANLLSYSTQQPVDYGDPLLSQTIQYNVGTGGKSSCTPTGRALTPRILLKVKNRK